jgi:hypothetical protein
MGSIRWRRRIAALALGTLLSAIGLGAWVAWNETYVEGTERCGRCQRVREVDRRALIWFRSDPRSDGLTPAESGACANHEWHRIGCWIVGSTSGLYSVH